MDSEFLEIEEDIEQHTEDSKLDTRWIEDFELEDGKYKPFYKDDLKFIKFKRNLEFKNKVISQILLILKIIVIY